MKRYIKKYLGKMIRMVYKLSYRWIPVDEKMILFISFHGRGYTDNPKALHQLIIADEKYNDYKCIWAIKKNKGVTIEGAKVIKYFSIPYFFYLARSKYWFCNCKLPKYVLKKDSQIYLQTWHGTPLKRLAHDIEVPEGTTFYRSGMNFDEMQSTYDNDVSKYTYMISPNSFCTEVFQSAFRIKREKLIETGYPRNDFIVNITEEKVEKIKEKIGVPLNKKIILYAPTWRDNCFDISGYTFELKVDFHKWKEVLGEDYVVIFKPHYLIVSTYADDDMDGFLINIDAKADINDLYVISDVLITDYSSVFFDYAILNRPIYFFMYDIQEYKEELRGFYLDINTELPGPILTDEEELLRCIIKGKCNQNKLTDFNKRFNYLEDGQSSKRVLNIVLEK